MMGMVMCSFLFVSSILTRFNGKKNSWQNERVVEGEKGAI